MPENTPEEQAEGIVNLSADAVERNDISEATPQSAKGNTVDTSRAPEARMQPAAKKKLSRLLKSVGMGMPGNKVRSFIGKGAIPPVIEKKHFVARLKALDRIDVTIIEGDDADPDNNEFVGEIGLSNVRLREDGRAEIEMSFQVEKDGMVTVIVSDLLGRTESRGRFNLPQFTGDVPNDDLKAIPVEELSVKLGLLEQQMKLLKGELTVRNERDKQST